MSAEDELNVKVTADVDDLSSGMGNAAQAVEEAAEKMEESFGGIGEAVESIRDRVNEAFEIFGAKVAYEALEKIADAMEEIAEKGEHLEQTATLYQTNTRALQGLYTAAVQTGVGTEGMDRALRTLEMRLESAREGSTSMQKKLEEVGISMDNLRDPTFQATDALYKLADSDASTGHLMSVLGPRAILVANSFEKLKEGQEEVNESSEKLGALTEAQIATLSEYHEEIATLSMQFDNFKSSLVAGMIPAIEAIIDGFRDLFTSFGNGAGVIESLKLVFEQLITTILTLIGYVKFSADAIIGAFTLIGKAAGGLAAIIMSLRHPFTELGNTASVVWDDLKATTATASSQMDHDLAATTSMVNNFAMAFEGLNEIKVTAKKMPAYEPIEIPPPKVKKEEDPILKMLGIEMEEAKKGSEQRIELAEEYATRSAQVYKGDVDKAIDAYKKVYDATKEFNEQKIKDAEAAAKAINDNTNRSFDEGQKLLEQAHSAKKLDDATYLADELNLLQQKLAADEKYYDELDKLDAGSSEKMAKNAEARVKMEENAAKNISDANAKYAEETEKAWESAMKPIESSWSQAMQSMANGSETFQQAIKKMLDNMVTGLFGNAINTIIHNWVTGENQKTQASIIADRIRTSSAQTAASQTSATNAQVAEQDITTKAAQSGAGAFSAMVSIPYVGPVLAVAAMAAAEAAVLALVGKIASAEGGMVVNQDQMAMVHEDEMILPRHISQGINERILGNEPLGSTKGNSGGNGSSHYHISAHDSKSFEKFVSSQAGRNALAKAGKMASMRGNRNIRDRSR